MFTFEQWLFILAIMVLVILLSRLLQLERECDRKCLVLGYWIGVAFFYLVLYSIIIGKFELLPEIISSAVIALLTLAFVWVELSKRPEFKLLDFVPVIREQEKPPLIHRADHKRGIKMRSRVLGIKEAEIEGRSFKGKISFTIDLSNIGYTETVAHEYYYYVDREERGPEVCGTLDDRWKMESQRRRTIDLPLLGIADNKLHKVRLKVRATTMTCSKEVWFFISEDFKKLRYVEMPLIKRLFIDWLIEDKLKDP